MLRRFNLGCIFIGRLISNNLFSFPFWGYWLSSSKPLCIFHSFGPKQRSVVLFLSFFPSRVFLLAQKELWALSPLPHQFPALFFLGGQHFHSRVDGRGGVLARLHFLPPTSSALRVRADRGEGGGGGGGWLVAEGGPEP